MILGLITTLRHLLASEKFILADLCKILRVDVCGDLLDDEEDDECEGE